MSKSVFAGLKVLEFSWYAAGPMITKYLADYGAEVIHVESTTRPDGFRSYPPFRDNIPGPNRSAVYAMHNNNKYGMTLNLKHPEGLAIAKKLTARADVLLENFTPGTIARLGLGYEELRRTNPGLVMISTCNMGQTGPHAHQPGFGSQLTSLMGIVELTGWPDRDPVLLWGPYVDYIGVVYGAIALVVALDYRRRTGQGQYIDVSQYECGLQFIAPVLLDYVTSGRVATRDGNRCDYAAPHGAYPCKGADRWCVIGIFSDADWVNFGRALGNPAWATDPRFATLQGRKKHEEEIDQLIAAWTSQFPAEEVMARLQAHGVDAGVVRYGEDIFTDPHLVRYAWTKLDHPELGRHRYQLPPFKLSRSPAEINRPAPLLGEHNEYVCTRILGYSISEYQRLSAEGVFL